MVVLLEDWIIRGIYRFVCKLKIFCSSNEMIIFL